MQMLTLGERFEYSPKHIPVVVYMLIMLSVCYLYTLLFDIPADLIKHWSNIFTVA